MTYFDEERVTDLLKEVRPPVRMAKWHALAATGTAGTRPGRWWRATPFRLPVFAGLIGLTTAGTIALSLTGTHGFQSNRSPAPASTTTTTSSAPSPVAPHAASSSTPQSQPAPTGSPGVSSAPIPPPTSSGSPTSSAVATPTPSATVTPPPGSITVKLVDASYVSSASPSSNHGAETELRASNKTPFARTYLKFSVLGLSKVPSHVDLRLYSTSSGSGFQSHGGSDQWDQSTLTMDNAPGYGPATHYHPAFAANAWQSIDVSSIVTSNGTFTIVITADTATSFSSPSYPGNYSPQLVVTP